MAPVALGESDRTRAKPISADGAAALVDSGDWVEYGTGIGQPDAFDAALAQRVDELEDVKIRACLTVRPRAVLEVVCTFGVGTKMQYETADSNPDFLCHAVDLTNPPHIVMQNDRVVAINSTTQMDLQGQAASESAGHRHTVAPLRASAPGPDTTSNGWTEPPQSATARRERLHERRARHDVGCLTQPEAAERLDVVRVDRCPG